MTDDRTIALYDARAADYGRAFGKLRMDDDLRAFVDALAANARVLDLGCGTGRSASLMVAHGLDVDPVDGSAGMVAVAQDTYGLPARLMTFDQLDGDQCYDGVWANFSLTHAPHDDLPRHLTAIARALRPGGMFHIGMKTGTGTLRDTLGRFYALHTPDELARHVTEAGFAVRHLREGAEKGFAETVDPYAILLAERIHG